MKPSFAGHTGPRVLHEGRGYSKGVGLSCSTYNPWPVPPYPRGVGRLEEARAATVPPTPRRSTVSAIMRSWMAPGGTAGRVRSFRCPVSPPWPSHRPAHPSHCPIEDLLLAPGLRSPPDDCAEIPVAWRKTQSSIGKYVLDGGTVADNETGVAPAEKNPPAHRPGKEGGGEGTPSAHLSLAPTHESGRSCSLSSSSPRSPRCPQQHPGSRRRRHHRRRPRSVPWPRSRRRSPRRRPPPRPARRPPP